MNDLVQPIPKKGGRSPQRQRRAQWEADYKAAQRVVVGRSLGWCEFPGCDRAASEFHHKRKRDLPGANDPERLMHLCWTCHHVRIHANPAESYAQGWLERRS